MYVPQAMDTTDPEKSGPKPAEVDGTTMLQLLCDCSGIFQPGILTALVGSSGAGKTTLMDVLAGRKTSERPVTSASIARYALAELLLLLFLALFLITQPTKCSRVCLASWAGEVSA